MTRMLLMLILAGNVVLAQNAVVGKWKSIDDATGQQKSVVEIFEREGKVFGRVTKIFPGPEDDPDPVCEECSNDDPRYKKKIIGMEIIRNLEKDGNEYTSGDILDPENGKVYTCKLWLESESLKVRGYWGVFYRTQTWSRAD